MLEERIQLQKEADSKIEQMEKDAYEKADKYLNDHTSALEIENKKLEKELRACILETQEYLKRKDSLEKENIELKREQKIRENLLRLRIDMVKKAGEKVSKERAKTKELMAIKNIKMVHDGVLRRGLPDIDNDLKDALSASAALDERQSKKSLKKSIGRISFKKHMASKKERAVLQMVVTAGNDTKTDKLKTASKEEKTKKQEGVSINFEDWVDYDDIDDEYCII